MKRTTGLLAVALTVSLTACANNTSDRICRKNVCVDTPTLFCLLGPDDPPDTAYMAFSVVASGAPGDAKYTISGGSRLDGQYTVGGNGARKHDLQTTGKALTVEIREGNTLVRRLKADPSEQCH